ncbi:hypothetical protein OC846_001765 [Tilletia horrida]|uniref:Uncharacterized protein n=1 Tax=Tilletia horrida TaxID=155126 RepID=A0AAN6JZL4_9BASI|nr:hypothetical protein OC845_002850 [Tilletia horrida]KAK0555337.1 hypothetical protein OC846_001765 [Tilletia horrida]KAK0568512.1 hypothetical protein OC861_001842 [Tilletia horrida]
MFSDVYGSSSLLADLRRGSAASTTSDSSSASDTSSSSSSSGFAAAARLEAARDEGAEETAATHRRMSAFSGFKLEKRPSLYGDSPRIASSFPADSEAQGTAAIRGGETTIVKNTSAVTASTVFAGPTMKYLLSGGNPASLIPNEAKKAFRFRRMTSRSRVTSTNYATMSAGGPLSLPRLFAALVLLCTVGVLVVPIPASAIRPHTRSYSAHGPMGSHHAAHPSHRHEMIEAGHLIPTHYSAGLFNSRLGGSHAHYLDQRRAADRHGGSFRNHHAAVLSKLGSTKRGPEAIDFEHQPSVEFETAVSDQDLHPKHTGHDLLAINRGMMALSTAAQTNSSSQTHSELEEQILTSLPAHTHNRHRYAMHGIGHSGGFQDRHRRLLPEPGAVPVVNSADLSPFARPPPSLAAADLFDPQNVFSQPSGGLPAQAMVGLFDLDAKALIESFDTGLGGLRGQGYLSHLRSLS